MVNTRQTTNIVLFIVFYSPFHDAFGKFLQAMPLVTVTGTSQVKLLQGCYGVYLCLSAISSLGKYKVVVYSSNNRKHNLSKFLSCVNR